MAVEEESEAQRELYDAVAHWRAHGFGPWLVEENDRTIGILEVHYAGPGVTGIEPNEVEVGWAVVEHARGRGVATEAALAAVADAWARTDAPWLVAYIRPENAMSIRVADRLGMRHVADGLTRSGDPMLIYRLPRPNTLRG
jgi:RimJ/RimL family protein N-acetyltransferase